MLPCPAVLKNYQPVTAERLKKTRRQQLADDPPHLRRLGLQLHCRKINTGNVGKLKPVWVFSTGEARVTRVSLRSSTTA